MKNIKYSELLSKNRVLGKSVDADPYDVYVLSNITTTQINDILEYSLRIEGVNTIVHSGDYDNIVQDSLKYSDSKAILIFCELINIVDGLNYRADLMSEKEIVSIIEKVKSEINITLENLKSTPLIIFNQFSSLITNYSYPTNNNLDMICDELNEYLRLAVPSNVLIVDINKIIAYCSIGKSVDYRYYASSKALYTIDYYKTYVSHIKPAIMSVLGKAKKSLIMDCDNTLWGGIIGEEGVEGIRVGGGDGAGAVYQEIQSMALALANKGVILGLCSKNNPDDVLAALDNHPDMTIRRSDITVHRINWDDKVTNLVSISEELNISLDSIVYIDDSDYEINYIKAQLPQVTVCKTPESLDEYPDMFRELSTLFYSASSTSEDAQRNAMYKQQKERATAKRKFNNINEYLDSLNLKMTIYGDERSQIKRVSQMTQRTNQFNLTTVRYTEPEIESMMYDKDQQIYTFDVSDDYGAYGLTGLCIIFYDRADNGATIDTLLMSCRVIGRNLEYAFIDSIINNVKKGGVETLYARYKKTLKNDQVSSLFDKIGLSVIKEADDCVDYKMNIDDYVSCNPTKVEIAYGSEN